MRRLIAILSLATFLVGILTLTGSSSSYAASSLPPEASTDVKTARVIAGSDRYETAVLVSQAGFPQGAPTVVIARGDDFADALCSAPLAYAYGGPLLLTRKSGLPETVMSELRRLSPSQVFLIGIGDGSSPLLTQIKNVVGPQSVTTLIGKDRYETAALVADQISAKTGPPDRVVIAPGDSFADALAVGPLASLNHWPILYTPQHGELPQITRHELMKLGVDSALEIGTYAHVDLPNVVRKVGVDRYDTCALIADYALGQGLSATHVAFARGDSFPDGLSAAPYLASDKGLLLLTNTTGVPAPIEEFLAPRAAGIRTLEAIGLATVPTGSWALLSQTPSPSLSNQDDKQPNPETPLVVPPSSTTTTTQPSSIDVVVDAPTSSTAPPPATTTSSTSPQVSTTRTTLPVTPTSALPPSSNVSLPIQSPATVSPFVLRSGLTYNGLTVDAVGRTYGIYGDGLSGTVVKNVTINGGDFGFKLGGGPVSKSVSVDGLTIKDARTGVYIDTVQSSTFADLNVSSPRDSRSNQYHALYLESNLAGITIKDSVFRGGSGFVVQLWSEGGQSRDITFENVTFDARSGTNCLVIGPKFDNIRFRNCTFYGNADSVFFFLGGSNIVISDFVAFGGDRLIEGHADSVLLQNGVYHGSTIGTANGVTLQNVIREP